MMCMAITVNSNDVFAGPARAVTFAECPMIQSDYMPDGWVYAEDFSSTVFKGSMLGFGIHCKGPPNYTHQEVYCGGVQVPQNEVSTSEFYGNGNEEYWYQVIIPLKYAKYGMINIPVRGIEGGVQYINLPMLKTEEATPVN